MFNIPSLDPFKIEAADADHSSGNSNFNLRSSLKNAEVRGFTDEIDVTKVVTKLDRKFQMKIEAQSKNVEIVGDYTMSGRILVLPINGVGRTNMTMKDVNVLIMVKGDFIDRNSERFIKITSLSVKFLTAKHANFLFTDIFKGDKVLTETINNFMNENWLLLMNTLIPGYEGEFSEKFKVIADKIFSSVPMKNIFKD